MVVAKKLGVSLGGSATSQQVLKMKIDGTRARGGPLQSRRCGRPPFGYRSVETPVAHPLFSLGYDAASFMLFGGPTAHGHSGQAFSKSARNGAPPVVSVTMKKQTRVILPR